MWLTPTDLRHDDAASAHPASQFVDRAEGGPPPELTRGNVIEFEFGQ
jgi:hypothetical protein